MIEDLNIPVYDAKIVTLAELFFNSVFCFWKKPIIEMGYFKEDDSFIARVSYKNVIWPGSKPTYAGMLHKHNKPTSKQVVHAGSYPELQAKVKQYILFSRVTFKILTSETLHSFGKVTGSIKFHAQ